MLYSKSMTEVGVEQIHYNDEGFSYRGEKFSKDQLERIYAMNPELAFLKSFSCGKYESVFGRNYKERNPIPEQFSQIEQVLYRNSREDLIGVWRSIFASETKDIHDNLLGMIVLQDRQARSLEDKLRIAQDVDAMKRVIQLFEQSYEAKYNQLNHDKENATVEQQSFEVALAREKAAYFESTAPSSERDYRKFWQSVRIEQRPIERYNPRSSATSDYVVFSYNTSDWWTVKPSGQSKEDMQTAQDLTTFMRCRFQWHSNMLQDRYCEIAFPLASSKKDSLQRSFNIARAVDDLCSPLGVTREDTTRILQATPVDDPSFVRDIDKLHQMFNLSGNSNAHLLCEVRYHHGWYGSPETGYGITSDLVSKAQRFAKDYLDDSDGNSFIDIRVHTAEELGIISEVRSSAYEAKFKRRPSLPVSPHIYQGVRYRRPDSEELPVQWHTPADYGKVIYMYDRKYSGDVGANRDRRKRHYSIGWSMGGAAVMFADDIEYQQIVESARERMRYDKQRLEQYVQQSKGSSQGHEIVTRKIELLNSWLDELNQPKDAVYAKHELKGQMADTIVLALTPALGHNTCHFLGPTPEIHNPGQSALWTTSRLTLDTGFTMQTSKASEVPGLKQMVRGIVEIYTGAVLPGANPEVERIAHIHGDNFNRLNYPIGTSISSGLRGYRDTCYSPRSIVFLNATDRLVYKPSIDRELRNTNPDAIVLVAANETGHCLPASSDVRTQFPWNLLTYATSSQRDLLLTLLERQADDKRDVGIRSSLITADPATFSHLQDGRGAIDGNRVRLLGHGMGLADPLIDDLARFWSSYANRILHP